jgi:pilus assembly protein Flp/PilA
MSAADREGTIDMLRISKFFKNKSGATAIEYGLIAALIAVAVIGGVSSLGSNANKTFTKISSKMG